MAIDAGETGLATLAFARQKMLGLLEDIPEDKYLHQPLPGGNHTMWIIGHLAATDDTFMSGLKPRESRLPGEWGALFGRGSKPHGDASVYPSISELKEQLTDLREELMAWFGSMSEEQLASPLSEDWAPFGVNYASLMGSLAYHEGLHSGQLTMVRRSLGIAPRFG